MKEITTEERIKKQSEQRARLIQRNLNDLGQVLSTAEGRRVIWKIVADSGVFRETFDKDPSTAAFLEGRRKSGVLLFQDIFNHYPEHLIKMRNEYKSDLLQLHEENNYTGSKVE